MAPAIPENLLIVLQVLLDELTLPSLPTAIFLHPSSVQMLPNHGVTPEQVPFHLAPVPCQVTVILPE